MTLLIADPLLALNQITLMAAAGFAGGLYLFVRGFHMLSRKRLLINTPTSKIRSASLGLVEVNGVATGPHTLPTPISGEPCFLYRTTAWQQNDQNKTGEWKKVAEETLHVPFFLDDHTGQLLIEPMGAELDLHRDFTQNYSDTIFSPQATQAVLNFLARHGVGTSNKIRIEECSVRPNNPLFILGTLGANPGIEVRPRGAEADRLRPTIAPPHSPAVPAPEVVRLSESPTASLSGGMTQQSKITAALSKAGITSPAAWQAAGVPYQQLNEAPQVHEVSINCENPRTQPETESSFDLRPPVVLLKGTTNPTFLISWRTQKEVVGSLSWECIAMIWGGGALAMVGIYVLLQQLQVL